MESHLPDLMTEEEIQLYQILYRKHKEKKERREKRSRFARTWGLALLTVLLVFEVVVLWNWE